MLVTLYLDLYISPKTDKPHAPIFALQKSVQLEATLEKYTQQVSSGCGHRHPFQIFQQIPQRSLYHLQVAFRPQPLTLSPLGYAVPYCLLPTV